MECEPIEDREIFESQKPQGILTNPETSIRTARALLLFADPLPDQLHGPFVSHVGSERGHLAGAALGEAVEED